MLKLIPEGDTLDALAVALFAVVADAAAEPSLEVRRVGIECVVDAPAASEDDTGDWLPDKDVAINDELFEIGDLDIVTLAGEIALPLVPAVETDTADEVKLPLVPLKLEVTGGVSALDVPCAKEAEEAMGVVFAAIVELLCVAELDTEAGATVTDTVAVVGICESFSVTVVAFPVIVLLESAGAVP